MNQRSNIKSQKNKGYFGMSDDEFGRLAKLVQDKQSRFAKERDSPPTSPRRRNSKLNKSVNVEGIRNNAKMESGAFSQLNNSEIQNMTM